MLVMAIIPRLRRRSRVIECTLPAYIHIMFVIHSLRKTDDSASSALPLAVNIVTPVLWSTFILQLSIFGQKNFRRLRVLAQYQSPFLLEFVVVSSVLGIMYILWGSEFGGDRVFFMSRSASLAMGAICCIAFYLWGPISFSVIPLYIFIMAAERKTKEFIGNHPEADSAWTFGQHMALLNSIASFTGTVVQPAIEQRLVLQGRLETFVQLIDYETYIMRRLMIAWMGK